MRTYSNTTVTVIVDVKLGPFVRWISPSCQGAEISAAEIKKGPIKKGQWPDKVSPKYWRISSR